MSITHEQSVIQVIFHDSMVEAVFRNSFIQDGETIGVQEVSKSYNTQPPRFEEVDNNLVVDGHFAVGHRLTFVLQSKQYVLELTDAHLPVDDDLGFGIDQNQVVAYIEELVEPDNIYINVAAEDNGNNDFWTVIQFLDGPMPQIDVIDPDDPPTTPMPNQINVSVVTINDVPQLLPTLVRNFVDINYK